MCLNGSLSTSRERATCAPIVPGSAIDLVLEARVELHVPHLVDELGREVAALLLVVLRQHQPAELGRDSLLGDHQRAEREVEELALGLVEPGPVGRVRDQVDVLGRPVRVLPVEVELLRVLELGGGLAHAGHPGADDRRGRVLVHAVGLPDLDASKPAASSSRSKSVARQRAGDQPVHCCMSCGSPRPSRGRRLRR